MSAPAPSTRPFHQSIGDPYLRASAALRLFDADSSNAPALAEYLKSLVALGLGGAGRQIIDRLAASAGVSAEGQRFLDQLREVVDQCPAGRVDWADCTARFAANLTALQRRSPDTARAVGGAEVGGHELYRDRHGTYHVFDLESLGWCCGLANRRAAAAAAFAAPSPINPAAPIAFDGIGLGELFDEFMRRSCRTFLSYSAAVAVIEPDPAALSIALRLHAWHDFLADPRVAIFTGPQADREYLAYLAADPNQPIPASVQSVPMKSRAPTGIHSGLRSLAESRENGKRLAISELNARYEPLDNRHWARRFADARDGCGRPLRVMGITSRFTTVLRYSMRELLDAAARAGCQTELVWEQYDHAIEYNVPARVRDFEPDLIVMLSRMRHEFPDIPRNVPFLCWDQDALPVMRTPEAGQSLDRLTFVAGYGAWFGLSHLGWPKTQALAEVPIAASHAYVTAPRDMPIEDRFRCDIAYISHCSETPHQMRDRLAENWAGHPLLARIFAVVTDRLLKRAEHGHNWTPGEIYALGIEGAGECGVKLDDSIHRELCMACMSLSDRAFRHHALECVARFAEQTGRKFHLYGNGWDRHARLAPFAAGRVSFGDEFVAACRGAKLNLQLIEGGFLHSRSLDGLAAGGAFLTRSTRYDTERSRLRSLRLAQADGNTSIADAGLNFWLQTIPLEPDAIALLPDLPRISFTNFDSLVATAEELLSNDSLREQIAANMRTAALAEFTYDAHWSRLVTFIRRSLERE